MKMKSIQFQVPEHDHRKIKMRAAMMGVGIKKYVLYALYVLHRDEAQEFEGLDIKKFKDNDKK